MFKRHHLWLISGFARLQNPATTHSSPKVPGSVLTVTDYARRVMTHDACDRVHGVGKRENTSQRWFPERFMAQQCRECAVLRKRRKGSYLAPVQRGTGQGPWTDGAGFEAWFLFPRQTTAASVQTSLSRSSFPHSRD